MLHKGLFGLRLASGLHLGHYSGNLSPAVARKDESTTYVVLADVFTVQSGRPRELIIQNLKKMIAECLACGLDNKNVLFVLQSELLRETSTVLVLLSGLLSFNQMKQIQPVKNILQDPDFISVSQIVFPVLQCSELLSLQVNYFYSNTDNSGISSFSNKSIRKINSTFGTSFPTAKHIHGPVPLLLGPDRRKMSFSSGNAIYLSSDREEIERKVKSIRTDPVAGETSPDLSIVFDYFRVINFPSAQISQLQEDYIRQSLTTLELKMTLVEALVRFVEPIRERASAILNEMDGYFLDRLFQDTLQAINAARETKEKLFSMIMADYVKLGI